LTYPIRGGTLAFIHLSDLLTNQKTGALAVSNSSLAFFLRHKDLHTHILWRFI